MNGASVALPFTDFNLNVVNKSGTIKVDASQFYLSFGNAFMKLTSCVSTPYGLCASTEFNPSASINKYLPNDQYWIGGACVSCPTGWTALNGRCFQRFATSLAYDAAQSSCKAQNASLAVLNTDAKFNLAKSLLPTGGSGIVNKLYNMLLDFKNYSFL